MGQSAASTPTKAPVEPKIEREYREWVEGLLGPVSVLVVVILCMSSKVPHDLVVDEQGTALRDVLALQPDEVRMASPALARVLVKANIPVHARKRLLNSKDYIDLGLVALSWGDRVYRTLGYIKLQQQGGVPHVTRKQPVTEQVPAINGHQPTNITDFGQYQPG